MAAEVPKSCLLKASRDSQSFQVRKQELPPSHDDIIDFKYLKAVELGGTVQVIVKKYETKWD